MINENSLLELIKEQNGFEVTLGFREDVDHFIGGTGNKIWYFISRGNTEDYYVCTLTGGEKNDVHYIRKKKILTSKPAQSGKTVELVLSELSTGQAEIESDGRKPVKTEVSGHPCSHYSFSFGERAYKISDEFGITVEYSNINDEASGFRLRNIRTGDDVKAPKED